MNATRHGRSRRVSAARSMARMVAGDSTCAAHTIPQRKHRSRQETKRQLQQSVHHRVREGTPANIQLLYCYLHMHARRLPATVRAAANTTAVTQQGTHHVQRCHKLLQQQLPEAALQQHQLTRLHQLLLAAVLSGPRGVWLVLQPAVLRARPRRHALRGCRRTDRTHVPCETVTGCVMCATA